MATIPTARQIKRWQDAMEDAKQKIGAQRDRLRAIHEEIEDVLETNERGLDALQESIDALSELL